MSAVFFDSKNADCKVPFGAVNDKTAVTLTLYVSRRWTTKEVLLHIQKEGEDSVFYPCEWSTLRLGYDGYSVTLPPLSPGLYWYRFSVDGCPIGNSGGFATENSDGAWQITVFEQGFQTPDWLKGGLFYHIFVDRFAKGGTHPVKEGAVLHPSWEDEPVWRPDEHGKVLNCDFFGGDLKGITEKLPYLKSLGVTCLYLSPIFEAFSNHKYDTADYEKIDSMFGDEKDYVNLCDSAHNLGLHVILDGVFNHVGADSRYFNRYGRYEDLGAYQSKDSPYYSWFSFSHYPDRYDSWWGFETLPQVNEESQSFCEYIAGDNGILHKWMALGADGFRLDVADELPDGFIETLRTRVKREKTDALLLGEVWEDASTKIAYGKRRRYFQGRELDSVMNYPFKNALLNFVRNRDGESLAATVTSICENYPKCVVDCLMNPLGTHDSDRAITALAGDLIQNATRQQKAETRLSESSWKEGIRLLKMASALQMTLPGIPCIYYGDEAGMEGYNDPFNRFPYPWGKENKDLIAWYRRLGEIRRKCPALTDGTAEILESKNGVFAFLRKNGRQTLLVAVNRGEEDYPFAFRHTALDLLNDKPITIGEYSLSKDNILIAEVDDK